MMPATLPAWMESWPRPGPTVRSSMTVSVAGSAPARSSTARSLALCGGEVAGDLAAAAEDRLADLRRGDHLVVEDDGKQACRHSAGSPGRSAARPCNRSVNETTGSLVLLVERRLRIDEVLAGNDDAVLDQIRHRRIVLRYMTVEPAGGRPLSASCTGIDWSTIWKVSLAVWPRISFRRCGSCRPGTWTRMRSVALALDDRLGGAEFVDAVADDLDRLRHRASTCDSRCRRRSACI